MTRTRWLAGALALGVLAAVLAAWIGRDDDTPAAPAAPMPTARPRPAAPAPARVRQAAAGTATAAAELPLAAQFEQYMASGDPALAFAAYRLIADCVEFNDRHDRLVFDRRIAARAPRDTIMPGYRAMTDDEKRHDAAYCAGLTARQREARLDALARAAKAGVPGAAVAFADEGPFGDRSALRTRPDDPLVQAWKASANAQLAQAADGGDAATLIYFAPALLSGTDVVERDAALAYRYNMALGLIYADLLGPGDPAAKAFTQQIPGMVEAELDPAARAAALEAARRIAALERARRERATRDGGRQ